MKTTISLFLLLITFCSLAMVRTVSNNASRSAQFATFDAAQTAPRKWMSKCSIRSNSPFSRPGPAFITLVGNALVTVPGDAYQWSPLKDYTR